MIIGRFRDHHPTATFLIGAIFLVGETYRYNMLALAPEVASVFCSYQ